MDKYNYDKLLDTYHNTDYTMNTQNSHFHFADTLERNIL